MKHLYFILITLFLFFSCSENNRNKELLFSNSKYIKNHAKDPVEWHLWDGNVFSEAKKENKLIIISIGYYACHWCHVMQNESFANKETAKIMNKYYYNVKIDREQLPDVDAYYAKLQKKMIGWAGWPMHFILNSEKKVIWTGIYMKPEKWRKHLTSVAKSYNKNKNYIYTENLLNEKKQKITDEFTFQNINNKLIQRFDTINGGLIPTHYSRKYPKPYLLKYLLSQYEVTKNDTIATFLINTANKMSMGGINDQIEGGFFRFSMDANWHIPHFEKMLYTNANMISFYSKMYKVFKKEEYKDCAKQTANFIFNNLSSKTPLFYGSLDADQITEGSYYTYSADELKLGLSNDFNFCKAYYNISYNNVWNDTSYHLFRVLSDKEFIKQHNIPRKKFLIKQQSINKKLKFIRTNKHSPGKDDKLISSWNALLISSFIDLYEATADVQHLKQAKKMISFFEKKHEKDKEIKHYYFDENATNSKSYPKDYLYLANSIIKYSKYEEEKIYMNFASILFLHFQENMKTNPKFPDKDNAFPSINAMQNIVAKKLNVFYKTDKYKYLKFNLEEILKNPEEYGLQLEFLSKKK